MTLDLLLQDPEEADFRNCWHVLHSVCTVQCVYGTSCVRHSVYCTACVLYSMCTAHVYCTSCVLYSECTAILCTAHVYCTACVLHMCTAVCILHMCIVQHVYCTAFLMWAWHSNLELLFYSQGPNAVLRRKFEVDAVSLEVLELPTGYAEHRWFLGGELETHPPPSFALPFGCLME